MTEKLRARVPSVRASLEEVHFWQREGGALEKLKCSSKESESMRLGRGWRDDEEPSNLLANGDEVDVG